MRKFILRLGVVSLFFLLVLPSSAFAFRFNVDPPRVEVKVNAGEKKNSYVTLTNMDTTRSIHIKTYVQDLVYLPDGSNDFVPAGSTPWSCSKWIIRQPEEFDIDAGQERNFKFQVKAPPDAEGGYYSVIFFEVYTSPKDGEDANSIGIAIRIGTIVLVEIEGTAKYKAKLTGMSIADPDPKIKDGSVLDFTCTVKNLGNIIARPSGTIQILDASGEEQAVLDINSNKGGVFPGTARTYKVSLKESLPKGKYTARALLDYGGDSLLGGQKTFNLR